MLASVFFVLSDGLGLRTCDKTHEATNDTISSKYILCFISYYLRLI